jgi:hypothetical protein
MPEAAYFSDLKRALPPKLRYATTEPRWDYTAQITKMHGYLEERQHLARRWRFVKASFYRLAKTCHFLFVLLHFDARYCNRPGFSYLLSCHPPIGSESSFSRRNNR